MFKCKLLAPTLNYQNQRVVIQAEVIEGNFRQFYDNNDTDALYSVDVKRWRNRRSGDANAYFHVLVGKIADTMGMSKAEAKNRMLAQYGQIAIEDKKPVYLIVGTVSEARSAGLSEAEIMSTKDKEMLEQKYGVQINESL